MKKFLIFSLIFNSIISMANIKDYIRTDVIENKNFKINNKSDSTITYNKNNDDETLVFNYSLINNNNEFLKIKNNLINSKSKNYNNIKVNENNNYTILTYSTNNNLVINDIIFHSKKVKNLIIVITYINKKDRAEISNELALKLIDYSEKFIY